MTVTLQKDFDVKELAHRETKGLLVSLYMGLEPTGANPGANRIRLKNLLAQTETILEERTMDNQAKNALLESLGKLNEYKFFMETKYPGLGILVELDKPEDLTVLPLRIQPETRVSVGENFFLTPLIEDSMNETVTLVSLADNSIHLYKAHRGGVEPMELPDNCPKDLAEVKRFEESAGLDGNELYKNRTVRNQTSSPHGEGPGENLEEEFHRRYYRMIGQVLRDRFNDPILLAGVREKLAGFREENPNLDILKRELDGNYEHLTRDRIEADVEKLLSERVNEVTQEHLNSALKQPDNLRIEDPEKLEDAAKQGRVERLFLHQAKSTMEFYDRVALEVLRHGGQVRIVNLESWHGPVLGQLRW